MTFLRNSGLSEGEPEVGFDYLHQVELSCAVAGQDQYVWMAYLFIDLYHERDGDNLLEDYESQMAQMAQLSQVGQGFDVEDPLLGKSSGRPLHKPREYYLELLARRTSQAEWEWHRTVNHVLKYAKKTVSIQNAAISSCIMFLWLISIPAQVLHLGVTAGCLHH